MMLAAISFFTDYWLPAQHGEETELTVVIIILIMVSLSGMLRFWQEYHTNKGGRSIKIYGAYHRNGAPPPQL